MDDIERRHRNTGGAEDQQNLVSGEFATNTEEELKRLVGVIVSSFVFFLGSQLSGSLDGSWEKKPN